MQNMSKADRFLKGLTEMPVMDKKWIFGNETDDPLRFAFDAKRVVHPSVRGGMVPEKDIASMWNGFMSREGGKCKRAVYIHIPFCQTRCLYCGFFQNFSNKELEDAYIERLIKELSMNSMSAFMRSHPVHAVYIGGGTPSALSAANIKRLLEAIHLNLPLSNDYEMTFESRVHEFDDEKIEACINGGINRFSLGVQSFNTKVRRCIGRIDDGEKVIERLKYIHSLDNAAVIIDLMYGLPFQTIDVWKEDVAMLIKSGIDGGDLYQLNVYEDGKLKEAMDKGILPPAAKTSEQAVMFKVGVEIMEQARYKRLSICHWANNTRERNMYNQLSKSGFITLPFGAGAGGKIDGHTFFVDRDIKSYLQRIDRGEKPIMFMTLPPENYELHQEIIGGMDLGRLNLAMLADKYGVDLEDMIAPLVEQWQTKGLIKISDGFIELTIAGQFWYVNLTQAILDWLVMIKGKGNHSLNVNAIEAQR